MTEYVIDFLIIVVVVMAIATVGYGLWNAGDGASINRGTTQGRR